MNLATLRSRVSGTIGLSNTSGHAEQVLMDGWFNEAIVKFLAATKLHVRSAALALTADQGDYELDADILAFKAVWIEPNGDGQESPLEAADPADITAYRRLQGGVADPSVRRYALEGANLLMLYPAPGNSNDRLHILYVPRPAAISATAGTPSATANGGIPEEYHDILEAYVKWKAAEFADDASSSVGQAYKAEWEQGLAYVRSQITRKGGVHVGRARIGRARLRWPVGNGVDTGV